MSSALRGLALLLIVAAGCANAGNGGTGPGDDSPAKVDAATPKMDAHSVPIDGLPPIDGPGQQIDAPLQQIDAAIDAPDQSGPFCSDNSQCTNAGECCFNFGSGMGFCVPGDIILGQCFPSS